MNLILLEVKCIKGSPCENIVKYCSSRGICVIWKMMKSQSLGWHIYYKKFQLVQKIYRNYYATNHSIMKEKSTKTNVLNRDPVCFRRAASQAKFQVHHEEIRHRLVTHYMFLLTLHVKSFHDELGTLHTNSEIQDRWSQIKCSCAHLINMVSERNYCLWSSSPNPSIRIIQFFLSTIKEF